MLAVTADIDTDVAAIRALMGVAHRCSSVLGSGDDVTVSREATKAGFSLWSGARGSSLQSMARRALRDVQRGAGDRSEPTGDAAYSPAAGSVEPL